MKKIGVIVGSLRKDSYNKKIAEIISKRLESDYEVEFISIDGLPLYNEDLDKDGVVPEEWKKLRKKVSEMDAYVFATPEYNRSVPAVLKNALDIGSRPYGQNVWSGKPAGIISVSTGNIGGFGANHHLRQTMTFLDVFVMQQPEAYISNVTSSFDENGKISERTEKYLNSIADSMNNWFKRFL